MVKFYRAAKRAILAIIILPHLLSKIIFLPNNIYCKYVCLMLKTM